MAVLTFLLCAVPCFAQFRVAHWNVARLFGDTNAIQDVFSYQ